MIAHIDHVNISVQDLARSVHFYSELLGFEKTTEAHLEGEWIETIVGLKGVVADVSYVQPPDGGPRIELIKYHAPAGTATDTNSLPNTRGLRHLAFRVTDMDGIYERLTAADVEFIGPPVIVPPTIVTHDAGHKKLCYFYDPDNVVLELAEYT
ncbi:MAG: VOC family protein [Lentisphaeria bacterium]|jgi:catechol 2,3-dioxygenase-like lactoylglutathione lyase family enzyme|nr:VOC family protein [Lentisphaeria bacterium]